MLQKTSFAGSGKIRNCRSEASDNGKADIKINAAHQKHRNEIDLNVKLQDVGPPALEAVHELVSLVHDGVNASNQQCTSTSGSTVISDGECSNTVNTKSDCTNDANQQGQCASKSDSGVITDNVSKNRLITKLYRLEDDSIANILWNLEPLDLLATFLAMVQSFPRTLEALILHMLSPVGAEVLTRKFDELDQHLTDEERLSRMFCSYTWE